MLIVFLTGITKVSAITIWANVSKSDVTKSIEKALKQKADIDVAGADIPKLWSYPNESFWIESTIINSGDISTKTEFAVNLYIITGDPSIDYVEKKECVKTFLVPSLEPGQTYIEKSYFSFPDFGNSFFDEQRETYIVWILDSWDMVDEYNENGTYMIQPINYYPAFIDTSIKNITVMKDAVTEDDEYQVEALVEIKQSNMWMFGFEGYFDVALYVSFDNKYKNNDDYKISKTTISCKEDENKSSWVTFNFKFPRFNERKGSYSVWLWVIVNEKQEYKRFDPDEDNNVMLYDVPINVNKHPSPSLSHSITKTRFNLLSGETETTTLKITNEGERDSILEGRVYSYEDWIKIDSALFDLERYDDHEVTIEIDSLDLKPGEYEGEIVISSNDPYDEEVSIVLYVTIADIPPKIDYTIEETSFTLLQDEIAWTNLEIANNGERDSILKCEIETSEDWIIVSEPEFNIQQGDKESIRIKIDPSKLGIGDFRGKIYIHSNDPDDQSICIRIYLQVIDAIPTLVYEIEETKPELPINNNTTLILTISNQGDEESKLIGSLESDVEWMKIEEDSFSLAEGRSINIEVYINSEGLEISSYKGTLMIRSNDPEHPRIPIPIILTVSQNKRIVTLQIGNKIAFIQDGVGGSKQQIRLDVPPTIVNGRTMVPLRFLAETFGAQIEWFAEEEEIQITYHDVFVQLWLHRKNGRMFDAMVQKGNDLPTTIVLDTPPAIIQGRTMVPLRFIAETFGAKVEWNDATQTIVLMVTLKE